MTYLNNPNSEQELRAWAFEQVIAHNQLWASGAVAAPSAPIVAAIRAADILADYIDNGTTKSDLTENFFAEFHRGGLAGPMAIDGHSDIVDKGKEFVPAQRPGGLDVTNIAQKTVDQPFASEGIVAHDETPVSGLDTETVAEPGTGASSVSGEG